MADSKKVQRIKLRCEGSAVKLDGTVTECSPDNKRIKVVFDGPHEDTVLYSYGDLKMVSNMSDREAKPTEDTRLMAKGLWWEVL